MLYYTAHLMLTLCYEALSVPELVMRAALLKDVLASGADLRFRAGIDMR